MRLIQQNKHNPQILEVVWMWLPTFIGENKQVLGELDHALSAAFPPPIEISEAVLNHMHLFVIDFLCGKFKIPGLREYLLAVGCVDHTESELRMEILQMFKDLFKPAVDWEAVERGEEVIDNRTGIKIQLVSESVKGAPKHRGEGK